MRTLLFLGLYLAAAAVPAYADSTSDAVQRAALATFHAKSLHMTVANATGPAVDLDLVPPANMHVKVGGSMEMIKIGSAMYVNVKGKWHQMHIPGMGMLTNIVGNAQQYAKPDSFNAVDKGSSIVDGMSLHAYDVTGKTTHAKVPTTMYVGDDGFIHRMDVHSRAGATTIKFSNFNVPVTIVAPI